MLNFEILIEDISKEVIEAGSLSKLKFILFEKEVDLRNSSGFEEDLIKHILTEVERKVIKHFKSLENLELNQKDYERLKQTWHDCLNCQEKFFVFSTKEEYGEQTVDTARRIVKFLEVNEKVKIYEPHQTLKYTLSYEQEVGTIVNEKGLKFSASRSLIRVYKSGVQLVANIHFFIRACPVCSRYAHYDGILTYCPECNESEYIAYPTIDIHYMMAPEYDEDSLGNRANSNYGHDDWSDEDIDDIFEGDPDNAWNVE